MGQTHFVSKMSNSEKQTLAIEWFKNMSEIKKSRENGLVSKVIAKDVHVLSGAKKYGILWKGKEGEMIDHIAKGQNEHLYEMIDFNSPARLFFDMDFKSKDEFGFGCDIPPNQVVVMFMEELQLFVNKLIGHDSGKFNAKEVLITQCKRLDRPDKHSFHLVYPKIVFRNITQMRAFVLSFGHYLFEEKHMMSLAFQKKGKNRSLGRAVFDMSPYTRDRLFRLMGQSKMGEPYENTLRPVKIQEVYETSNNFFDNLIDDNGISSHAQIITLRYSELENISDYMVQPCSFLDMDATPPSTTLGDLIHNSVLKNYGNVPLKTYVAAKQDRRGVTITLLGNNNKTPGNLKSAKDNILPVDWHTLIKEEFRGKEINIENDEQFLEFFTARELKEADYVYYYLNFISDICHFIPDKTMLTWMNGCDDYVSTRSERKLFYAKESSSKKPITGRFALSLLENVYGVGNINDLRNPVPKPIGDFKNVKRTVMTTEEWEPIEARDLRSRILTEQNKDLKTNNYINGAITMDFEKEEEYAKIGVPEDEEGNRIEMAQRFNSKKRAYFISGQMGASKSSGTLESIVELVMKGMMKNVLIITPRIVLAKQTILKLFTVYKELLGDSKVKRDFKKTNDIDITAMFHKAYQDKEIRQVKEWCRGRINPEMEHCNICVSLINSIHRLNRAVYDTIIFDEPITCIDNFYIELHTKNSTENAAEVVANTISRRNAIVNRLTGFTMLSNQLFFIDAAFTPDSINLCKSLYYGEYSFIVSPREWNKHMRSEGVGDTTVKNTCKRINKENLEIRKRIRIVKTRSEDKSQMIQKEEVTYKIFREPQMICVYDKSLEKPIFQKIIDYKSKNKLLNTLLETICEGQKVVVYCSTQKESERLYHAVKGWTERKMSWIPMLILITGSTVKKEPGEVVNKIKDGDVIFTTSVVGVGTSISEEGLFDCAFMICKLSVGSPLLSDMIQLSARVRATKNRVLHMNISCGQFGVDCSKLTRELHSFQPANYMYGGFMDCLDITHRNRRLFHHVCISNYTIARETMLSEITDALGHVKDATLSRISPEYIYVKDVDHRFLATRDITEQRQLAQKLDVLDCRMEHTEEFVDFVGLYKNKKEGRRVVAKINVQKKNELLHEFWQKSKIGREGYTPVTHKAYSLKRSHSTMVEHDMDDNESTNKKQELEEEDEECIDIDEYNNERF